MKSVHLTAYKTFQQQLAAARKAAGLSQEDLASLLGKRQSFISKVEAGDRRLDVVEYVQWMRAVRADVETLISDLATDMERSGNRRTLAASKSKPSSAHVSRLKK